MVWGLRLLAKRSWGVECARLWRRVTAHLLLNPTLFCPCRASDCPLLSGSQPSSSRKRPAPGNEQPPPVPAAQQQHQAQPPAAQQQQEQQPSKRTRVARAAAKQAKLTGGTAPGSIRAFFKPTNLPAAAGGAGGGKGPGNCFRCGGSDHVRTGTQAVSG